MARDAVVLYGIPQSVERRTFAYTKGDRAGQEGEALSFRLFHGAAALAGKVRCEAQDPDVMREIEEACDRNQMVQLVAYPIPVRGKSEGKDDRERDWVKFSIRAVLGSPGAF